jgi:hypothetical protein
MVCVLIYEILASAVARVDGLVSLERQLLQFCTFI